MNKDNLELYIKISSDSIGALREVDVYRVISSVRPDNIDGITRADLAMFIATSRPDLLKEVSEVMLEEFPQAAWNPWPDEQGN
jgi:hypothetical protein